MEFEFDKEIDALLRQTARGKSVFTENNQHLDADEISAFAENALPERARQNYIVHFADCERCRKILSNVIALNSENIPAEETKTLAAVSAIPWYRKLFAYPDLAYTMGALILVFSGLIAFVVLQNNSPNAEVSQISERQSAGKGMSSDGDAVAPETSLSNSSSTSSVSNSNMAAVVSPNTATTNTSANVAVRNTNTSVVASRPTVTANEASRDESRRENDEAKNKTAQPENSFSMDGAAAAEKQESAKEDKKEAEATDAAKPAPKPQAPASTALSRSSVNDDATGAKAKKMSKADAETTNVGGKTFKRSNGVWIDSVYKGQATTNVTRGTSEYKKLDSNVRSIAENLGGTVVVVWKERAYRIQ